MPKRAGFIWKERWKLKKRHELGFERIFIDFTCLGFAVGGDGERFYVVRRKTASAVAGPHPAKMRQLWVHLSGWGKKSKLHLPKLRNASSMR